MPHPSSDHHSPEQSPHTKHASKPGGLHALLRLPDHGERFDEEWTVTQRRIQAVAAAPVPRETEPAGAPRLFRADL
ncbi:MAG TPA: hypothetical protein VGX97_01225 [bacterium]|nr:hypothetical protein [bacterium]